MKHLRFRTKTVTRGTIAAVAAVIVFSALAGGAAAAPSGEFANFAQCPVTDSAAESCLYAQSTSGEFAIGSTSVPLTNPVTLQGGLAEAGEGFDEVLPATNGETLSRSPQTVPGGLLKIVAPAAWPAWLRGIFNEFINKGLTGVTATTELVGKARLSAGNVFAQSGTALELPVRVHLENLFLGGSCYVGSASHPVTVNFTTGTTSPPPPNTPITGSRGKLEIRGEGRILAITNNSLVNNTFSAPEAEGCGGIFSFLVDPAVDAQLGLPSASGHNAAVLNGSQEIASVGSVEEHS